MHIKPNGLYTVMEVAQLTGAGAHNVRRWILRGHLRASRISDMRVIQGSDLLHTLERWQRGELELDAPKYGSIRVPQLV